jgi:hypothetical protein
VIICSVLASSWFGMQAIHEFGHVVGAWATGGRVERVVLHPLAISRTDFSDNPHPLIVAWSGPILGAMLPLLVWGSVSATRMRIVSLLRFFAGFCLIANGLYIGIGSFEGIGDCGDLLRAGASRWQLWLFGLLAVPLGVLLWHGLGPRLGLSFKTTQNERRRLRKA